MSQFSSLLDMAKKESQEQRMLFLFAKATNMLGADTKSYNSGTVDAVMCVDKKPEELSTFESLVAEADGYNNNWNIILFTTLSGKNNKPIEDQDVDVALHKMSNVFVKKDDLSNFVIWDREQQVVIIS